MFDTIAPAAEDRLSAGQCATLACLLEATAAKPGNVHRGADFEDMTFTDFAVSAAAIGPAMEAAAQRGVGATVLAAVQATRRLVPVNTNLGTVLLLAPLAAVPREQSLKAGIGQVLSNLTAADAEAVYAAIRRAEPGGLGTADQMDVAEAAPESLLAAMAAAADRDLVARQYTERFAPILEQAAPWIVQGCAAGWPLTDAIIHAQLRLLAAWPDSLIARKCGPSVAEHGSALAQRVLQAGVPGDADYLYELGELDFWMRSDGNRRNPGTTADLIAAGLFVVLRENLIRPPFR
jgi:triphosphoribosyl-dephospho-CoA synthase